MKIGVMLRTIDRHKGIGVYTQSLMDHLLPLDTKNEYVLFYYSPKSLGRYARYPHVREKLVAPPLSRPLLRASSSPDSSAYKGIWDQMNQAIWDQVKIPIEAKREGVDLLFNPTDSIPLFARCKKIMTFHDAAWYVFPQFHPRTVVYYVKLIMPMYLRRSDVVISVSNRAKQDIGIYTGTDLRKVKTIYLAADKGFSQTPDESMLKAIRAKYSLPERFILNVGHIYPSKNPKNILRAYAKLRGKIPHKLVMAGGMRWKYADELKPLEEYALHDDVVFLGLVPHEDLPAIYRMADLFLFPSKYESCPVALLEAMACGCPVVSSPVGGIPEVAGDAAILVDPNDPEAIAEAVYRVLTDEQLRQELSRRSLEQSKHFTWEKCARETLALFESVSDGNESS